MAPSDAMSYSVEAIQRSRDLAQVRDQKAQTERLLEAAKFRNQRLVEKVTELDGVIMRKSIEIRELNQRVLKLEHKLNESNLQHQHAQHHMAELKGEVVHRAHEVSDLRYRISELESRLVVQSTELEEPKQVQPKQHLVNGSSPRENPNEIRLLSKQKLDQQLDLKGLEEQVFNFKIPCQLQKRSPPSGLDTMPSGADVVVPKVKLANTNTHNLNDGLPKDSAERCKLSPKLSCRTLQFCGRPDGIPANSPRVSGKESSHILLDMREKVLQTMQTVLLRDGATPRSNSPCGPVAASPCKTSPRVGGSYREIRSPVLGTRMVMPNQEILRFS